MTPSGSGMISGRFLASEAWDPVVREQLERWVALPRTGPAPVAVFDFDQTCVEGDVSEFLLLLLAEERGRDLVAEYERDCAIDLRKAYVDLVFTLIAGLTEREARARAEWAIAEGARRGGLVVRAPIRELVWALQRHGWEVWVVTASAEVLVQAAAEHIGIHPNRVIGMRPHLDPDGRYAPPIREPIPFRDGKLELLRAAVGREPALALGDSRSDAWLLRAAERGILLDRGDVELSTELAAHGVWVQRAERIR